MFSKINAKPARKEAQRAQRQQRGGRGGSGTGAASTSAASRLTWQPDGPKPEIRFYRCK